MKSDRGPALNRWAFSCEQLAEGTSMPVARIAAYPSPLDLTNIAMLRLALHPDHPDDETLARAARILTGGGIVVYPTETVYGLAAACDNDHALARLFAAKGRRETKPVLLLIEAQAQLDGLCASILPEALELAGRWWPGPLTLLFKALPGLSPLLTGPAGMVACRISGNAVARRLVALAGRPITSTSANFAGGPSASRIDELPPSFIARVDALVDAGPTPGGPPSTILDVSRLPFHIVRQGAIPAHELV